MRKIKWLCSLIMTAVMTLSMSAGVRGEQYATVRNNGYANVVEIIDGESIKVNLLETGETALIRLIGVNSEGFDGAVSYLNSFLMGKRVYLSFDSYVSRIADYRWNNMYVQCDGVSVNASLLAKGLARVHTGHQNASDYTTFLNYERSAQRGKAGIWDVGKDLGSVASGSGSGSGYYVYTGDSVNINTATAYELQTLLIDISSSLASRIVSYRERNPFNDIYELKFVEGVTKDIFDRNRNNITVSTNISRATEKELLTLSNITQDEVDRIIDYRSRYGLTDIEQLYRQGLIAQYRFNEIRQFISTTDVRYVTYAIPDWTVNINTASVSQLVDVGLSNGQATAVVDYREGYSYKTLGELARLPGAGLTTSDINYYADNLIVGTDVNYDLININTATREQLRTIGLSDSAISSIYNRQGSMHYSRDIPVDIYEYMHKVSLYTDINTATTGELVSLSIYMTTGIANDIIRYRNDQPFGSLEEFRTFLRDKDAGNVYDVVRDFVVLR